MKNLNLLAVFLLVFTIGLTSCSDVEETIEEEVEMMDNQDVDDGLEVAPNFTLDTYDGGKIALSDYKDKVLVIFFFGNSCPPCKSIAPNIESKLNKAFNSNPSFGMIGIDQWNGNTASVEKFKNDTGVTFPLGIMGSGVARDFGTTFDRLVIVNTKSKIAFKGQSVAANDLDNVIIMVEELLN